MRITPSTPVSTGADDVPACAANPELYLDEMLDDPPVQSKVAKAVWAEYRQRLERVREACAACPLFAECLYRAVVEVDVSGYVGCTTPRERRRIRRMLGVTIESEDLDAAAGVRREGRPIDHDAVLATRAAFPNDSLASIAERLGCSLSTVKRHLRSAREGKTPGASRPKAKRTDVPSLDDVLDCFDAVVEADR
ncbi:MAG TPA: WhiB family transcriptional regulator [Nocardioidaceae bacterium]|nr:WhiB family transcriptional regulator [Nocardioidaceae bacterium]